MNDLRTQFRRLYRAEAPLRKAASLFGLSAEEMGLALHSAWLKKVTGQNIPPPEPAPIPWDQKPPVGKRFCDQCDKLVEASEAASCNSRWCKAKVAA